MDKFEYRLKLDQMKTLAGEKDYSGAAEIADTINWRRIKNVNLLIKAGDIYTKTGRYDEARDILLMAYDRSPIGRMIIYRLAELAIKMRNFEEAEEYYEEFIEIAPHDNLKYVLRYRISKATGMDHATLIGILEELKEVEYTEEWAYELAYLYHQSGETAKCIDACDELILWFGEGIHVERAMELKMLYQPLTKSQEDKYHILKQHRDGVKELYPHEETESVKIEIPSVFENTDRFNTMNLQEELAKSMKQIMEATEQETVSETMHNIKKMVDEIPYLKVPQEKKTGIQTQTEALHTPSDEVPEGSLSIDFKGIREDDYDIQPEMAEQENLPELQISGQMSIEDVLSEWEKTKRAAEAALQRAVEQKLESAKAKALQEAGDIMERLSDVIPQLEAGFTPGGMLEEEYLQQENLTDEERAGHIMKGMNDMLQQQIDRLKHEEKEQALAREHELMRRVKMAKPKFDDEIRIQLDEEPKAAYEPEEESESETSYGLEKEPEPAYEPEEEFESESEYRLEEEVREEIGEEIEEGYEPENVYRAGYENGEEIEDKLPEISIPDDIAAVLSKQDTKKMKADEITRALDSQIREMEAVGGDVEAGERPAITKLSEEQKTIFSYFVPVDGMERQICQVLTGASARLSSSRNSATGNILIQGGKGCGKTVLATSIIKALQKEVKRPNGKIGKITAEALNKKDVSELLKKVAGGCLIVEKAGGISRETAVKLSLLLENDSSGLLVIMEDTRLGLEQAMNQDDGLSKKFTEKIAIPVFTSDELVAFGKAYANDLDYEIDEMGVLALYNRISTIQRLDRATTLTEVKEVVDQAIQKAERGTLKKAFSILTSRRYNEEDYVILREKDFEE